MVLTLWSLITTSAPNSFAWIPVTLRLQKICAEAFLPKRIFVFHTFWKYPSQSLTKFELSSFQSEQQWKERIIIKMSGSKLYLALTCSSKIMDTKSSATFNDCFLNLPAMSRRMQTIWKFEGYKWKFRQSCSIAASTTTGGGVQIKFLRQKVFEYQPLGFNWVVYSSFGYHDPL